MNRGRRLPDQEPTHGPLERSHSTGAADAETRACRPRRLRQRWSPSLAPSSHRPAAPITRPDPADDPRDPGLRRLPIGELGGEPSSRTGPDPSTPSSSDPPIASTSSRAIRFPSSSPSSPATPAPTGAHASQRRAAAAAAAAGAGAGAADSGLGRTRRGGPLRRVVGLRPERWPPGAG